MKLLEVIRAEKTAKDFDERAEPRSRPAVSDLAAQGILLIISIVQLSAWPNSPSPFGSAIGSPSQDRRTR